MIRRTLAVIACAALALSASSAQPESKWISLFNGKDLTGWTARGKATWSVQHGVLVGIGGMGHLYSDVTCSDFEAKGMFRVTNLGAIPNSGFYFRANPPADDPDGFPRGYEAQICNHGDGYTGWLWKPGKPTGKATALRTKDGEWFRYRIRAVGTHIQFWINDKPVMTYDDAEYKRGHFAIQGHNPGMKVEAKALYYRPLHGS
jgi:3-keto-disaccharide hydrolase